MRKNRMIFWIVSLIICSIMVLIYNKEKNKIPQEEKIPIKVYCDMLELESGVKNIIEDSTLGENNRVVFTKSKSEAEFILTNKISASDTGYIKVGNSPLVVAFDKDSFKSYEEKNYLTKKKDDSYIMNFEKIINDVIKDEWDGEIYCPKSDTREGELFFKFLLANLNEGTYPNNENAIQDITKKANDFFSKSNIHQVDVIDQLKNKKSVEAQELYIFFEANLEKFKNNSYKFEICYPNNTVTYDIFYKTQGEKSEDSKNIINTKKWYNGELTLLERLLYDHNIRAKEQIHDKSYFKISDGFTKIEIPLN